MAQSLTYLGTFDDVVQRYPWAAPVNEAYLRTMIVRHVLFGGRLLLNDGYLVMHPLLQRALVQGAKNPLLGLIEEGFLAVLSTQEDIVSSIDARAESGVQSFVALRKSSIWDDVAPTLNAVSNRLRERKLFLAWPRKDMGSGFAAAMLRARGPESAVRPLTEIGLNGVPKQLADRVFSRFEETASRTTEALRTRWEEISREEVDRAFLLNRGRAMRELMGFANEAYHFNFASCLSAERDETVGVETRYSEAFDELLDTPEIEYDKLRGFAPLKTPNHPALFDAAKLRDFIVEGYPSFRKKAAYLEAQTQFLNGRIDGKHFEDASKEYARHIAEYFGADYVADKQSFVVSLALFSGTTVAGLALTPVAGAALGAVVFVAEQFVAPHVLRKVSVRQIEAQVRRRRYDGQRLSRQRVLASVMIDKGKAQSLVASLPDRAAA